MTRELNLYALSVRQPWAWFIMEELKPYENRNWNAKYLKQQITTVPPGSALYIHAAKGMTDEEYRDALRFAIDAGCPKLPSKRELQFGGLIGTVRFKQAVQKSSNPWFTGPIALHLVEPMPDIFQPCTGQLGFFKPHVEVIP